MPQQKPILVTVVEAFAPQSVDADAGVIRGVKIVGFESANNRVYPPQVLREAAALYEGRRVNVNHGAKPGEPRGYEDRAGQIRSVRFVESQGLYGDFHYNPKHRLAEQIAWDAQHNPGSMGFSHDAFLKIGPRPELRGRGVVEQIINVKSVDLVADPATTKSLFESEQPMDVAAAPPTTPASTDPLEMIVDSITTNCRFTFSEFLTCP